MLAPEEWYTLVPLQQRASRLGKTAQPCTESHTVSTLLEKAPDGTNAAKPCNTPASGTEDDSERAQSVQNKDGTVIDWDAVTGMVEIGTVTVAQVRLDEQSKSDKELG
jgi:hypothetical protein